MRKTIIVAIFILAGILACTHNAKKQNSVVTAPDTTVIASYPVPENYTQVGKLHTDTLTFKSFSMGDLAHFEFQNDAGESHDFNVVDQSRYTLVGDASQPSVDNGGYEANEKYLNKTFIVVWRTLQLNREPQDEMEFYYENYNEIVSLELLGK